MVNSAGITPDVLSKIRGSLRTMDSTTTSVIEMSNTTSANFDPMSSATSSTKRVFTDIFQLGDIKLLADDLAK